MKLTVKALVLLSAIAAAPAFANPDFADLSTATDVGGASDAITAVVATALADYTGGSPYDSSNYAFVTQLGDNNVGYIFQDAATGAGNFAAIIQDGSTTPGVGAITQSGNSNFAAIHQH